MFMTKKAHRAAMEAMEAKLDLSEFMRDHNADAARCHAQTIAELRAENATLRPLADKYLARAAQAKANLKQNRPKPADEWGPWFAGTGERPAGVGDDELVQSPTKEDDKWPPATAPASHWAFDDRDMCGCYRLRADHPYYRGTPA